MAWRDNLRPASFKGVPFHVEGASLTAGRRLARHEYPQRDTPYMEDMGRKAREYKVDAFVVGPDYMDERDALLKALESEGAGQLVHPYYGTLQVVASGDSSITESSAQGGMARLSITFVEAGEQALPSASADTSAVLQSRYSAAQDAFAADFASNFSVDGQPDFVVDDALLSVDQALALPGMGLGELDWIRANPDSTLTALLPENLSASIQAPLSLAQGLLAQVASAASALDLVNYSLPTVGGTTGSRQALNNNRDAMAGLIVQAAVAKRIMEITAADYATLEDARTARAEVVSRVDTVLFAESTGQSSADALVQLRTDAVAHFAALAPSLPRLTNFTPRAVRPAWVLAHDFYGDAWLIDGRDTQIQQRNRITRPGFVPAGQPLSLVV